MSKTMNLTLHVWRQKLPSDVGGFETYKAPDISEHMSFLEMIDVLNEELAKKVEDVVEVAKVAREESGVTFTHFNTGYHFEDDPKKRAMHGLVQARPFVSAIRRNVGGFIGMQAVPVTLLKP